jgi:hypothetical protein
MSGPPENFAGDRSMALRLVSREEFVLVSTAQHDKAINPRMKA